jgi:hypothetical protein
MCREGSDRERENAILPVSSLIVLRSRTKKVVIVLRSCTFSCIRYMLVFR